MLDEVVLYTKEKNDYIKEEKGILNLDKYKRNNLLHANFKLQFLPYEIKKTFI